MFPGEVREHLIDRLAPIFGMPKNANSLAEELIKHVATGVTRDQLHVLAQHIIDTRKAKSFPSASELIAAVTTLAPPRHAMGPDGIPGEIGFDGEIPMIWVFAEDPRWKELCEVATGLEPRYGGRHSRPYPMTSKYAPGVGRFFRAAHVRGVSITDAEREQIARLYARAQATPTVAPAERAAA